MPTLTQHNDNSLSNDINREEEYSGYSKFQKIQEICIKNKEKLNTYSMIWTSIYIIITLILFYCMSLLPYNVVILCPMVVMIQVSIYLISCSVSSYYGKKEDRIYSKFPAIVGFISTIILAYLMFRPSYVGYESPFGNILGFSIFSLIVWGIIYSYHCTVVNILETTKYKNPQIEYTARVVDLEHDAQTKEEHFYVYFYDYTYRLNKQEIEKGQFNWLKKGDAINVALQPRICDVKLKKIKRIDNFEGLTDMEIDQNIHMKDVELYGQSQDEINDATGKVKKLSFRSYFTGVAIIAILSTLLLEMYKKAVYNETLETIFLGSNNCLAYVLIFAFAVTIVVSCIEYVRIKKEYTYEDLLIWGDFLLPRCLFYFSTTLYSTALLIALYLLLI